jgi:hypothetical protein
MKTLDEVAFLAWGDRAGVCLDPQYPESAVLVFRPDPQQDRFWEVPIEPERRPYFLLSFLELMGDWAGVLRLETLGQLAGVCRAASHQRRRRMAVFGWSVGEDLYVVHDHARFILQTDHHNVIHVSYRSSADVDEWVRQMEGRGCALPEEVPDSTFKRPDWMK